MDLLFYIVFMALAMGLFFLAIYERAWIYTLFAVPFIVLLIPSSFIITDLHTDTIIGPGDVPVTIHPSSVWVQTGTLNSGNIIDLQASDGGLYDVQEVTGVPGYDVRFIFSQCDLIPNTLVINLTYTGGLGHTPSVELYDGEDEAWDTIFNLSDSASGSFNDYIINGLDYQGDGCLHAGRLYHHDTGDGGHEIEIDEVYLAGRLSQAETFSEEVPYGGRLWALASLWVVFLIIDVMLFYVLFTIEGVKALTPDASKLDAEEPGPP